MTYTIPDLPYLRLRFTLRSEGEAVLPPFKGSLLRGAFGHALRRAVCAYGPGQECAACPLRRLCVYTRLFETFIEEAPPPFLRGLDTAPRPYVFEPLTGARDFAPGDPLAFDLLLFGQAVELQAYVLLAVERMAAAGLGSGRFPFVLDEARALDPAGVWQTLYRKGRATPRAPLPPSPPPAGLEGDRAVLRFVTPTRLKVRSQLAETLRVRDLVFAMLRRTLEILHFHHPGAALDWNLRPLLDAASALQVTATRLTWRDLTRYSNRQQRKTPLGGFTGTLTLEGDLPPFARLLRTAEILHVGKGTTFGLGRLQIEG